MIDRDDPREANSCGLTCTNSFFIDCAHPNATPTSFTPTINLGPQTDRPNYVSRLTFGSHSILRTLACSDSDRKSAKNEPEQSCNERRDADLFGMLSIGLLHSVGCGRTCAISWSHIGHEECFSINALNDENLKYKKQTQYLLRNDAYHGVLRDDYTAISSQKA